MKKIVKERFALFAGIFLFSVVVTYVSLQVIHYQRSVLPPEERPERSKELQELREREWKERHERFHTLVEERLLAAEKESTCIACHGVIPHKKDKKVRSLINMHTEYLLCESCHLHPDIRKNAVFKWFSPNSDDLKGKQYGTDYDREGRLIEPDMHAQIAPFVNNSPYMMSGNLERAKEDMKMWETLSDDRKKELKRHYHKDMEDKGPKCENCHSKESVMDFRSLGFSDKRRAEVMHPAVTGLITKYREFYIPDLFRRE